MNLRWGLHGRSGNSCATVYTMVLDLTTEKDCVCLCVLARPREQDDK